MPLWTESGLCAGGEHHGSFLLALAELYERDPDKSSGPPAVIMPTLQTSKPRFRGVIAERAQMCLFQNHK